MAQVLWENAPDAHDYPAADSYLSLLVGDSRLRASLIARLQAAPVAHYKAKDLLRASREPLLTIDNPHVAADLRKIRKGRALSPVLLVRGDLLRGFPLQIADGYHRVCASFWVNENTDIPCRLIDLSGTAVSQPESPPRRWQSPRRPRRQRRPLRKKSAPPKKAAPAKKASPRKVAKKVLAKKAPAAVVAPPAPEAGAQPVSPSA